AAESLADDGARIGGLDRVEHVLHLQAGGGEPVGLGRNAQGGSVVLTLELQIRHSALAPQSRDDPVTDLVQRLQIVTEDLDGHLRRLAAEALADAIAEEGDDLSLDAGIAGEDL